MHEARKKVVIVGAGTAGLVIANNLKEYFDVVVVEKSKHKKYPLLFRIPMLIGLLFRNRNTKYISNRDILLSSGRKIPFFESNLMGGASIINGCVHVVGSKLGWRAILKRFDATYEDLMKSYGKIYASGRGVEGKINLISPPQNIIDLSFIDTLNNKQIMRGDVDFSDRQNCGPISVTARKYFRTSVLSLIRRPLFGIFLGEKVEDFLFDHSGKLTGIETNKRTLDASYVILSGGVIGTCDLLLRAKGGDNSSHIFKGLHIGDGIQDHTNIRINVVSNKKVGSLNEVYSSMYQRAWLLIKHLLGKKTLMIGTGASSAVHLDLDGDGVVDTRVQIVQFTEAGRHGSDGKYFGEEPGFSLSITAIKPKSRGQFSIKSDGNVVDPGYLSQNEDIHLLKLALRYCLELLRSSPINEHVREILDVDLIESNPEKYIMDTMFSGHHLIGGAHNAVNSQFQVHDMPGLYICDASVFGEYAASNIHSSVVLLADIFSKKFVANNKNH